MNIVGVVAEYNPLHNGHIYQIEKIKEMYKDSIIIVALSGNYTQRGEFSIINKWDKARISINSGVDIVLEIPFIFSNQSADTFSYAALKMLSEFKIDTLVFGSESNDKEKLIKAAKVQINNNQFDKEVKKFMDKGDNYPTSLNKAIKSICNISINESNDLLGVSYIKEIISKQYDINVSLVRRTNSFLDLESDSSIVSANNIRNKFKKNVSVEKYLPSYSLKYMNNFDEDFLFSLLKYKIISEKDRLDKYHLVDEGIHNRIYKAALSARNISELIELIKSKRITYNKINRILINILVNFTKDEASRFKN